MVDLTARPYYLSQADLTWVEKTIAGMSDEEKVGQLFFQLTVSDDAEYLRKLCEKYHVGGCRYNPMTGKQVRRHNEILQQYTKIPLFIACNTETGGNGACTDGTYIGAAIKIGATGNTAYAKALGELANREAAAVGCNMAFAPVCDIHRNWQNTEIVMRSFGEDVKQVTRMSKAYLAGVHRLEGFACAAKHFPGNGYDFRDAHLSNAVNPLSLDEWMESYGAVYRALIEADLEAIMGGHILMPAYVRQVSPSTPDEQMLPATLCPEIMRGLLRERLGFNGMVVTDASHMVAMTNRMPRREMLPASINAGCDMFLFFNDPDEDFQTMLTAYRTGVIRPERMEEALRRILGLKARMGLHKCSRPSDCVKTQDGREVARQISKDAITLVKYKDQQVLPLTKDKYRRILIVPIHGASGGMETFIKLAMGEGEGKSAAQRLKEKLAAKGFDPVIYESPIEKMKQEVAAGRKPSLNLYFAGKNAIADFVAQQDLVITLFDVASGRPSFGMSKGGGEIPWYVFELPVIGISVNSPTMLADVPQLRTYINAYDDKDDTLDILVEKLLSGPSAFVGTDPIDSFCGLWDAHI